MDRLTTGRRHVRAGSVHVTELINKQVLRTGVPAPLAAPTATVLAALPQESAGPREPERAASPSPGGDPAEPVDPIEPGPVSHRRPPSRGAQFAKLTSLGAATLVLCGAVAAASMISHQRADERTAERPAVRITGDQALLPDQLERTLPSSGERVRPAAKEPAAAATPAAPGTPEPTADAREHPAPASAAPATERRPVPSPAQPMSDVALVQTFYDLLQRDPDSAFELISPNLLSTTLGEFLDSWSTVRDIEVVEVSEHADGAVAVVRLTLADGGHLLIQELLTVADSPRRITGVQLLSAQRN